MNRLLIIIVIVLLPIAVCMEDEKKNLDVIINQDENYNLELTFLEPKKEDNTTMVMLSNNRDKSDAYTLELEEYIIGVVAGEMPASFNMEALKAQAVAARSYALYKLNNISNYVLSTSVSDQVYLSKDKMKKKWGNDYDKYYNRVKKAVDETRGEVIKYNDKVISAYYFAISNGYTDDGGVVFNENKDYLVSVNSSWDKNYQSYKSTYKMKSSDFCTELGVPNKKVSIKDVVRSSSNYVRSININGVTLSGREVFNKLGLKSMDFDISVSDDVVIIKTYGFGHGVGMSQYGAQGMAEEGYNYQEILEHYYQKTNVEKI